jgi:Ribonuclease toxin, BrnT, of type II toxin-antitoxin system/Calcium binding
MKKTRKRKCTTGPVRLSKARLDRLVEEAIVDCYNESEKATGLYTMIEEHLALPFATAVLGVPVAVEGVQLTLRDAAYRHWPHGNVGLRTAMQRQTPLIYLHGSDPLSATGPDPDHSLDEERFVTFGVSSRDRLLVIANTERGDTIRIISARAVTPGERKDL